MVEVIIAVIGLGVGDYTDPLNLTAQDKDNNVVIQETCDTTTESDNYGQVSTSKTCITMKTITTIEQSD